MTERANRRIDRVVAEIKRDAGCVPRAIGSAVGVEPPEYAYILRVIDMVKGDPPTLSEIRRIPDPDEQLATLRREDEKDNRNIRRLISRLSRDEGAFGEALRGFTVRRANLSSEQIRKRIADGDSVLLGGPVQTRPRARIRFHMSHVGLDSDGNLVSKSDREQIMELPDGVKFPSFVFRKKPQ